MTTVCSANRKSTDMSHTPIDPPSTPVMGTPNYTHALLTQGATQCDAVFANISELLKGADMTADDICHLRIFMLDRAHIPSLRRARTALLGDRVVPSTLVMVSGLVDPDWLVEVEFVAAAT